MPTQTWSSATIETLFRAQTKKNVQIVALGIVRLSAVARGDNIGYPVDIRKRPSIDIVKPFRRQDKNARAVNLMSMAIQQEIAELFRESEACGSCLICATGNLRRALDRLVAKGAALRPIPGGYVRPDHWNSLNPREQALHEIRALSRLHPAWTFCRTSAAIVHGLWVSNNLTHPHCIVASKSSHGCHRAGVIRCATEVADADIVTAGGIRVTTLLRTTMDCLRHLEFEAALPIADSSLRLSGATSEELTEHLRSSCAGHPGLIQALFTASHANGLSESGGESLARAIMIREGSCYRGFR